MEGLADLIAAETKAQQQQALAQMGASRAQSTLRCPLALAHAHGHRSHVARTAGASGAIYSAWRRELIHIVAHVEAFLDFGEDEGIEAEVLQNALTKVGRALLRAPSRSSAARSAHPAPLPRSRSCGKPCARIWQTGAREEKDACSYDV